MTFEEIVQQVRELLQREGRVSYRALKRRFALDDEYIEDLKAEFIDAKRLAVDEEGKVLAWMGVTPASGSLSQESDSLAPSSHSQSLDVGADAERRQLTVMFCDLVGSTALSTQLDPEDLRAVIQDYYQITTEKIRHFGGHLAQYLGDGVLAYFGYPTAHEDGAQRAVQAGLAIVGQLRMLRSRQLHPIHVRIGIHTGLVVIGDMGSGGSRQQIALGDTPNIAARIQGIADPDAVVISAATQKLVQGLFEHQVLGPHRLKGISTPLPLYRIVSEGKARNRFEAAVRAGLTPLVGREGECALLLRQWEKVKRGEGQVVLLCGEPGIGKSRLIQELKKQVVEQGATPIEFRCLPYYQHTAFYPIIAHLQRVLGFQREDTPSRKQEKLERVLSRYRFPRADTAPLLASLFSLPLSEGWAPLTMSPQKQRQKLQETLVQWLLEEAEHQTVYCVWEDLHWADPSTLELLELLLNHTSTPHILTLLSFRPEFTPPWKSQTPTTHLTLRRLEDTHTRKIVEQVTEGKALPQEVLQQIIAKTDGVPLFVEELTKMVVESELVKAVNNHYELTGSLPSLAIPVTIQDSLMARLDRLGIVKELAQLGATLGREFSYELIQAISPWDEEVLQEGLKQLTATELIYQRGQPPQAHYSFKHALIQEIAYQSLLKSVRQRYHQQIAQVLEEWLTDTADTHPELLAHHYTEAGLGARAIPYWQKAGQQAIARSANVEAIRHLTKGLEMLDSYANTSSRVQQELALLVALGVPLLMTKGYTSPEVERVYARARELCQQVGSPPELPQVLYGLRRFYFVKGEGQTAHELGQRFLELAQERAEPVLSLWGHCLVGETFLFLGKFVSAQEHLEKGLTFYEPDRYKSLAFLYGYDPGVAGRMVLARVKWLLGYPDQALRLCSETSALARQIAHPFSLAATLNFIAVVHQFCGDPRATQTCTEEVIAFSREQGFSFWEAWGSILKGWALAMQGKPGEGIALLRHGLAFFQSTGANNSLAYVLTLLAEAYGAAGQTEEALGVVEQTLANVSQTPELYRLKGELILQKFQVSGSKLQVPPTYQSLRPGAQEAEACFQQAIKIARHLQAKSLELRAATSLAHLWRHQGKTLEARRLLEGVYGWFTEGFNTVDLKEAKQLLDSLA